MTTLTIQTHNLDALQEKLAAVNKRLVKHGLSPASIASTRAEFKSRPVGSWAPSTEHVVELDPQDDLAAAWKTITASMEACVQDLVYVVQVEAPTDLIQWKGHVLCGRIQRSEGGDMITRIGEHELNLGQFRDQPFVCSHCHARRPRKAVWVFQREADGQLLTLGDGCSEDYFGADVSRLLEDSLALFSGTEEDEDWGYGGAHRPDSARAFLLATFGASLIAFEGYKSRKAHEDGCTSAQASALASWVKDKGFHHVDANLSSTWDKFTRTWWAHTAPRWQEFCQIVLDARAWWNEQTPAPSEDYLANCRTAMVGMNPRHAGLIVCGTWEFMKFKGLVGDPNRQEPFADTWLGQPKDKLKDIPVELVAIRAFDSDFGPRFYITLRDDAGHCLLWKTQTDINEDGSLVQGSRLLLSGSIKEHATRKDTKQTVLLRCKITLDPLRAAGTAA